jgi:hypothetical protein
VRAAWPPEDALRPGRGFELLGVGTPRADVVAVLGEPTGTHDDERVLSYLNRGVLVRLDAGGRVESLTLGAIFTSDGLRWPDVRLPEGLSWDALMPDVRDVLGEPIDFASGEVVAGSGRTHHIVRWPGLRVTFDEAGRLTSVSVP